MLHEIEYCNGKLVLMNQNKNERNNDRMINKRAKHGEKTQLKQSLY